jgi:hypothetical protein
MGRKRAERWVRTSSLGPGQSVMRRVAGACGDRGEEPSWKADTWVSESRRGLGEGANQRSLVPWRNASQSLTWPLDVGRVMQVEGVKVERVELEEQFLPLNRSSTKAGGTPMLVVETRRRWYPNWIAIVGG